MLVVKARLARRAAPPSDRSLGRRRLQVLLRRLLRHLRLPLPLQPQHLPDDEGVVGDVRRGGNVEVGARHKACPAAQLRQEEHRGEVLRA